MRENDVFSLSELSDDSKGLSCCRCEKMPVKTVTRYIHDMWVEKKLQNVINKQVQPETPAVSPKQQSFLVPSAYPAVEICFIYAGEIAG